MSVVLIQVRLLWRRGQYVYLRVLRRKQPKRNSAVSRSMAALYKRRFSRWTDCLFDQVEDFLNLPLRPGRLAR